MPKSRFRILVFWPSGLLYKQVYLKARAALTSECHNKNPLTTSTRIDVFISTLRTYEIYSQQIEDLLAIKSKIDNRKPMKQKESDRLSRWLDKVYQAN